MLRAHGATATAAEARLENREEVARCVSGGAEAAVAVS